MSETDTRKRVQLRLSPGTILFRNNQGQCIYQDDKGKTYYVKYGVGEGGGDLIGWTSRKITKDMVGKRVAIFTSIETKSQRGIKKGNQINFAKRVREAGGYAGFADNEEQAVEIVNGN